jgi:hypothetical protein
MYFSVKDFPKFIQETLHIGSWQDSFRDTGFKTYRITLDLADPDHITKRHWLDDEEFTWFVLRFS